MRTCPTCNARYEAPAQYCQVDGTPLTVDAPPQDPYIGKKILEQFRLVRVVGSGGMGVVYEGHDEGLGRRVAVKILHRDLVTNKDIVQRFHREAQIAHQLDHPGIVRVVLFGQLGDGNLYLVLEFLEGPTLMEALEADRVFAPSRAVKIIGSIADAIGYAHARGIVHRDLKPENIILTKREGDPEFPKVLDFGIAKTLIGSGSFVTQTGLIFGTARYISPEGASGEPVDQRGDVYSLGVMAYQLLTGHTPFESDEPMQLLLKHIHDTPPPMRHWTKELPVSPALEAVVMRALAKNADARYDDGNAFARALREAAGEAVEVRSVVPTTAMTTFTAPTGQVPAAAVAAARAAASVQPERVSGVPGALATTQPSATVTAAGALPVSAVESSGVSRVRTVTRGSNEPRVIPAGASHGVVGTAQGFAAPNLPPRMEMPVVSASVVPPPSEPPMGPVSVVDAPPPLAATRPRMSGYVSSDDDEFPVPKKTGGGAGRAFALVVVSVLVTITLAVAGAWGLRMFPSQRRDDEIAGLLRRSSDALALGRYVHAPAGNDVEDLTDAVLALDPQNARAQMLRRNAATRLKAASDAERLAGHPERAIPFLQDALRLLDDATLRDELAAAQREVDAQRNAQTPQVPRPVHPTPRPTPRPAVPREDPTLVHPAEPVQPLNPAVTPVPPPTQTPPTPPPTPPIARQRPRRDGGNVVQGSTPPDMSVLPPPEVHTQPVPVFGTPTQPPPPPDDGDGHTGAF